MSRLGMLTIAFLALVGGSAGAQQVPQSRAQIQLSFASVVKQTAPAVVNVYARRVVRQPGIPGFSDDPFFRRFFGDGGMFGRPRERVQNSLGSGVLVDPSGIVVTNNHVIQGGTEIRVVLSDRREFDATVALADEHTDLAILKLNAGQAKLPSLTLGDSDVLEVGDLVLAIGNPFGVGQTVTSGIVSALARTQVGITDYQFFIQTDAAINPGNSGGALIDVAGRLIGINTAIYSRSGGSIGIGFAIPANMVRTVVASAMNGGKVSRPWGGADLQDVTAEMGEVLGLDRPRGAIVASIHPLSPMVQAGVATGDVIVGVNRQAGGECQGVRLPDGHADGRPANRDRPDPQGQAALGQAGADAGTRQAGARGDADQGPHAADRRGGRQCLAGTRRRAWPRHLCQRRGGGRREGRAGGEHRLSQGRSPPRDQWRRRYRASRRCRQP